MKQKETSNGTSKTAVAGPQRLLFIRRVWEKRKTIHLPHKKRARSAAQSKAQSLSRRVMTIVVAGILCTALCISLLTALLMADAGRKVAEKAAESSYQVMASQFDGIATSLETDASVIAADSGVIQALVSKSSGEASRAFSAITQTLKVDSGTLLDQNGALRASTYFAQKDDSISSWNCVKFALSGKSIITVEPTAFTYSINVAMPVCRFNDMLGRVIVSYDLSDTDFVNGLKQQTGSDYAIYLGDTSIVTTLTDSTSKRITGDKLDAEVQETVLKQGDTLTRQETINGTRYLSVYAPIVSSDGTITGVMFSGYNMTTYYSGLYRSLMISLAAAVLLILLISFMGSNLLRRRLKQPLENVVLAVNGIASGEMTDATSEALAQLATNDEIGQLARSMEAAVGSVRKISDDTQYLEEAMRRNDLTVSVDTASHHGIYKLIADVVNRLFQEIGSNMKQIRGIAEGINNHTIQLTEAAQTLAQGSTEQAGAVEELSATINSIVTRVKQTAGSAKDAYGASQAAEAQVSSSSEQMTNMIAAMDEISATSEKIGEIVKTIDNIAFQTNLLALNAAVEAARVGAQGRGFAVVAGEVQNLAGQSAEAAKNTEELIESALEAVKKGSKYAHRAEEGMKSVVGKTARVNEMVSQITAATEEEADMLHQVREGVDQISVVVQTNSSVAEETAAASQGLSAQTRQLNDMVSKYRFN